MKKSILKNSYRIVFIAILMLSVNLVFGQDGLETAPEDVEDTPVDGGALLLMAGGAAWGLYKKRKQ
ncbi:MAG: PID-CTERM protein-sorting domain-containing protein [Sediminibacterium sp.]|jgi:hypothetical protein